MRTICVIVNMFEAYFVIEGIVNDFPCFFKGNKIDVDYVEIAFTCRQEDAKAIEERLAELM